jgi:predicted membrane channel-forming protein YqfA (hemolysin III family)
MSTQRRANEDRKSKKKITHALILLGALIILIGSITPIAYDLENEPHSFSNNLAALIILIALLFFIGILVLYSAFTKSAQIQRRMSILLLVLSILLLIIGTVSVVAVTAAIIDNEPGWGPGLYIMYVGILIFFIGSIINHQENRKPAKGEGVQKEGSYEEEQGKTPIQSKGEL